MNALLSFKRNGKADKASKAASRTVDPLMDGKVMLDELPAEHFSTLKFLDIKREEAAKRETEIESAGKQRTSGIAAANIGTDSTPIARSSATSTGSSSTAVQESQNGTSSAKPSRMQLFKDRISIERQDTIALPFAANTKAGTVGSRINLLASSATSVQTNPIRSLLNNGLVPADNAFAGLTHMAPNTPPNRTASADRQAQEQIQERTHAVSLNDALTTEHLQQAAHSSFCLTRSHENLAMVIGAYLNESDTNKTLTLQLSDASQFDYCAGGADLFIKPVGLTTHRLTETDRSRRLTVDGASRLSIDSLTAAHPLRQRSMDVDAFNGWFTEDGLDCDIGVSPIETFVQAELLHMQQQVQRTLVQLRRLSLHLQAKCPHLEPLEALHHGPQADAWMSQQGQAASASLYRLLECTMITKPADAEQGVQSVHEFFKHNPARLPAFSNIDWPHIPAGLQLLRTLATLSQPTGADKASATPMSAHLTERLAVLDVLMRDPATNRSITSQSTRIAVDAKTRENLLGNLRERFTDLAAQMHTAGLLQNTPHPEGKVRNAGKHA